MKYKVLDTFQSTSLKKKFFKGQEIELSREKARPYITSKHLADVKGAKDDE